MIMGHSKHKLSRKKKHVVLPKTNCHTTPLVFPITATTSPQWALSSVAKVAVNVERFNCTLNFLENHADRHQNCGKCLRIILYKNIFT